MRKVDWHSLADDLALVCGGYAVGILTCLLMVQVIAARL